MTENNSHTPENFRSISGSFYANPAKTWETMSEIPDWLPPRYYLCAVNDQLNCSRMFLDSLVVMEYSGCRDTSTSIFLVCSEPRGPAGKGLTSDHLEFGHL